MQSHESELAQASDDSCASGVRFAAARDTAAVVKLY